MARARPGGWTLAAPRPMDRTWRADLEGEGGGGWDEEPSFAEMRMERRKCCLIVHES